MPAIQFECWCTPTSMYYIITNFQNVINVYFDINWVRSGRHSSIVTLGICDFVRAISEMQSQLLEEYEHQHSVWSQSNKSRHISTEEAAWTRFGGVGDQRPQRGEFAWFCVHSTCLQHIQRLCQRCRNDAGYRRGQDVCNGVVVEEFPHQQPRFHLIVEGNLANCDEYAPTDGCACTGK